MGNTPRPPKLDPVERAGVEAAVLQRVGELENRIRADHQEGRRSHWDRQMAEDPYDEVEDRPFPPGIVLGVIMTTC